MKKCCFDWCVKTGSKQSSTYCWPWISVGCQKSKKKRNVLDEWCEPKFKYPGSMVRSAQIVHYEFTAQLNKMCFYCKWDLFNGDHLRVSRNSLTFFYSKKIELNLIYMQRRPLLLCKSNKIHWHFNYNSVGVHQGIRWLSVRPDATERDTAKNGSIKSVCTFHLCFLLCKLR